MNVLVSKNKIIILQIIIYIIIYKTKMWDSKIKNHFQV